MKYIGQCDKIRQTEQGEKFWQQLMKNRASISENLFLEHADVRFVLDNGETWEQYKNNCKMQNDKIKYFCSVVDCKDYVFMQHSGFEFIFGF